MQNTVNHLQNFGLHDLRGPEKIKVAISKYFRENPENLEGYAIAKIIWEELSISSWSLSSSFISQAKMYLTGPGDPTNGHGGYNYIKKPLKTRYIKFFLIFLFRNY